MPVAGGDGGLPAVKACMRGGKVEITGPSHATPPNLVYSSFGAGEKKKLIAGTARDGAKKLLAGERIYIHYFGNNIQLLQGFVAELQAEAAKAAADGAEAKPAEQL